MKTSIWDLNTIEPQNQSSKNIQLLECIRRMYWSIQRGSTPPFTICCSHLSFWLFIKYYLLIYLFYIFYFVLGESQFFTNSLRSYSIIKLKIIWDVFMHLLVDSPQQSSIIEQRIKELKFWCNLLMAQLHVITS